MYLRCHQSRYGFGTLWISLYFYVMLCYVMLCYVMLCHVMLCYVMLCYVIFVMIICYVMLCYVMLCYVMLCYVMLCYIMLCYVMLCYVMLCYVMLCYVILCYVMLCSVIEKKHCAAFAMKEYLNCPSLTPQGQNFLPTSQLTVKCCCYMEIPREQTHSLIRGHHRVYHIVTFHAFREESICDVSWNSPKKGLSHSGGYLFQSIISTFQGSRTR